MLAPCQPAYLFSIRADRGRYFTIRHSGVGGIQGMGVSFDKLPSTGSLRQAPFDRLPSTGSLRQAPFDRLRANDLRQAPFDKLRANDLLVYLPLSAPSGRGLGQG